MAGLNIIMDARVKPAHDSECVTPRLKDVIAGLVPGMTVKLHI